MRYRFQKFIKKQEQKFVKKNVSNSDLIRISDANHYFEMYINNQYSKLLISWEEYKKANWYESDAIDVEKLLMDQFLKNI